MNNRTWQLIMALIVGVFVVAVAADVRTNRPVIHGDQAVEEISAVDGQAILDAIEAAGYPSIDKMSAELKAQIITAVNSGALKTIDQETSNTGFNARLVGLTANKPCYLYRDSDVCLVVITNNKGELTSYFIDHNDSEHEESFSYSLGGFFGDDRYLVIADVQQNIGGHETGYAVNLQSGIASPIATIIGYVPEGGPIKDPTDCPEGNCHYEVSTVVEAAGFEYKGHDISVFVDTHPVIPNRYELNFTDDNFKLLDSFVVDSNPDPGGDEHLISIDYRDTASSIAPVFVTNAGRRVLNGGGLYMRVAGGLYYYDPSGDIVSLEGYSLPND